jgi:acetolactate synthase-1/2/3 large subunit
MPNDKTFSMLDLGSPSIDWQTVARGLGVSASPAATAEEFHSQFGAAMKREGPHLIEARIKQDIGKLFSKDG